MVAPSAVPVSEHLAKLSPALRATVEAVRRTVKEIAPDAAELAYRSQPPRSSRALWKIVRYLVDDAQVIGLGVFPDHACLFFANGRELDDGSALLEGSGQLLRFTRLRMPDDADRPALKDLLRRAFEEARTAGSPGR